MATRAHIYFGEVMLSLKQHLLNGHSWRCGQFLFRLQPLALLLTLAAFLLLIKLGFWQLQRAEEKQFLLKHADRLSQSDAVSTLSMFDGRDVEYATYRQSGSLLFRYALLLDNRIFQGQPGYNLVVPFQPIDGTGLVMVNLGWLPMGVDRDKLPDFEVVERTVEISGRLKSLSKQTMVLSEEAFPAQVRFPLRVQQINAEWMARWSQQDIAPWMVLLDEDLNLGYPRYWPLVTMSADKHVGYAVQWFGLALVLLVVAFRWMVKRASKD